MSESDDQIELLKEMTNWLRLIGMKQLIETINSVLTKNEEKLVYQHSDGYRTTREIEEFTGTNKDAIAKLWKKCFLSGLGEYKTASGGRRFKRTFDLELLGIVTIEKAKTKQLNSSNNNKDQSITVKEIQPITTVQPKQEGQINDE